VNAWAAALGILPCPLPAEVANHPDPTIAGGAWSRGGGLQISGSIAPTALGIPAGGAGGPLQNQAKIALESRVSELFAELAAATPALPCDSLASSRQERLQELQRQLAALDAWTDLESDVCPFCVQRSLMHVQESGDDECPFCCSSKLVWRLFDLVNCPVCRSGELVESQLRDRHVYCPICRGAGLKKVAKAKLSGGVGMAECPKCHARWQLLPHGRAELVEVHEDPYSNGQVYRGMTLTLSAWQEVAGHSRAFACKACEAVLQERVGGQLVLRSVGDDLWGVGKAYGGKELAVRDWAKLAQGLKLDAGNVACSACNSEFQYDLTKNTWRPTSVGKVARGRLGRLTEEALVGSEWSALDWRCLATGKRCRCQGWVCKNGSSVFMCKPRRK
jgi:hypothetical protein